MRERKSSGNNKKEELNKSPDKEEIDYGAGVSTPASYWKILPIALLIGVPFGFALEKGRVFEPQLIVDQMLMQKFQMMKMFLSAVATSMTVMTLMLGTEKTARYFNYSRAYIFKAPRGWPAVLLGAFVLGSGMSIAGACPGTVVVQAGAGVRQALYVVAGGLLAAGLYSYFEYKVRPFVATSCPPLTHRTLDKYLKTNYVSTALPMIGMLVACVVGLEWLFPWKSQLRDSLLSPNGAMASLLDVFKMPAWPPYIAGMVVGSLQIPAILLLTVSLGSATSFATVAIKALSLFSCETVEKSDYMKGLSRGIALWQPTYLLGAALGAFLSSYLSGSWHTVESFSPLRAFIGGFLLLLGSRLSGGCTSGHGISGFAYLASISIAAVPVMFAGAIGTAFALKAVGL